MNTVTNATQAKVNVALPILKGFANELRGLRIHGRHGASFKLKAEAAPVVAAALAYCGELAEEIGADTFLGCCGTPTEWAGLFNENEIA